MKKLTKTMQRSPQSPQEAKMLKVLLGEVDACFMAFALNCETPVVVNGMDQLIGGTCKEFAEKVAGCNRTVAFITFIRNGVLADITFCRGKDAVEAISLMFDGDTNTLRVP